MIDKGGMTMNKTLKSVLTIIGGITVGFLILGIMVFMFAFISVSILLGNATKAEEYTIGADTIPSIKAVVEERKITSVSTSTFNGITTKEMELKSSSVQEDLSEYIKYLKSNEQFYLLKEMDLSILPGTIQIAKESIEENQIIIMDIEYDSSGYTIKIRKGEGTLTIY